MPRQVGPVFIEGTFGDLIFYKLGEHYYVRQKPARKKRKQMEADERYARTLQQADQFGRASAISKWVYYRYVVKQVRRHGLFGELTGLVKRRLYSGQSEEEVKAWLIEYCKKLSETATTVVEAPVVPAGEVTPVAAVATQNTISSVYKPSNKRVRILSKWKVNRRGRLQVSRKRQVTPVSALAATANS